MEGFSSPISKQREWARQPTPASRPQDNAAHVWLDLLVSAKFFAVLFSPRALYICLHLQELAMIRPVIALVIGGSFVLTTAAAAQSIDKGKEVYAAQKCSVCHSIGATGNKKGPLDKVGAKLSADEIRSWITAAPDMAAKAKADRKPAMKAYTALTKDEVDSLVAYLQSLK
jgi:mono/diheme cytochrome c family protein